MAKQKVAFTLDYDEQSGKLGVSIVFTPALAGNESKKWAKMTEGEKHMQNYAGKIGIYVMEALNAENGE